MSVVAVKAQVRIVRGANLGQIYDLHAPETVLGRHSDCGIVLVSQTISRHHARIVRRGDGYYLEDLQSLNGTFVNGRRLEEPTRLDSGDRIQIHDVLLGFHQSGAEPHDSGSWQEAELDDDDEASPHSTSIVHAIDVWTGAATRVEVNPQIKLKALLDIMHNVGTSLDVDAVLANILDSLFSVFPQADRGHVLFLDAANGKLAPRATKVRADNGSDSQTLGLFGLNVARRAIVERQAILSADTNSGHSIEVSETIFGMEFRAIMCAPLVGPSGQPIGAVQLCTEGSGKSFVEADLDVLANVAALAGLLVESAHWHECKRAEELLAREHAATERERRRLRAVMEILPVGVAIVDAQGRVIETNPELRKLWGGHFPAIHGVEEYGQQLQAWWPQTGRRVASHEWGMARALANGEPCSAEEMEIETFDNHRRTVLGYASPIKDVTGRVIGGVAVMVDITDRKQVEQTILEADRRKDEFLAMLAHELRNPLAPIANALVLLRADQHDAEVSQWTLEMMERQVEHLVRLVDDLLDVSRITRGKIELKKEPVELAVVIEQAVDTARPLITAQRHELTIQMPAAKATIKVDRIRLSQVISNLLNNAAKYTPQGGAILLAAELDGPHAVIRVRDNGIGIAPETLPHVFDLFTQAERSLDRSQGGLGIGLSVVRRIIEMHDGSVSVTSKGLGHGTQFEVRIPRSDVPAQPPRAWQPSAVTPRRVLVVDDQPVQAPVIGKMLTRFWGHQVRMVHDGHAVLEAAQDFHPEVILLDIGLPGMNGYEVVKQLRALPDFHATLIVALSGYGHEDDLRRSEEAGFDRHLVKPASAAVIETVFVDPRLAAAAK
jgi:PAS domain S-box-containing protein